MRGLGDGAPEPKPGGLRRYQRQPSSTHTETLANLTSGAAAAGAGVFAAVYRVNNSPALLRGLSPYITLNMISLEA